MSDKRSTTDTTEEGYVKAEVERLKEVAKDYKVEDIKSGRWFERFLFFALKNYMNKVDWSFFQNKYPHLPADAIVTRRIDLAKSYAMIQGGLTASIYSGAVVATIGSHGGASPVTVPGAILNFSVDLLYTTQLQLQLAYDLAVLYRHPINTEDAEDMYDLLRVAFGIKAGEALRDFVPKATPEMVRQGIKAVVTGSRLAWLQALPVIGKYLLQRNIIKFAIPVVNIPLSVGLNHWQTGQVAKKARVIYRDKAAIQEYASELVAEHEVPADILLDTVYYMARADGHITAEESWLLKHLTDELSEEPSTADAVRKFSQMVSFDSQKFLDNIATLPSGTQAEVFDVALHVAACDHDIAKAELIALRKLSSVCAVPLDEEKLRASAKVGIG
jgi:hypothetical protein